MQNNADLRYYHSNTNWWRFDPKYLILNRISGTENVLDVGCSFGMFGYHLKQKGCIVDGIEIYPPAFEKSKTLLDHVFQLNLNSLDEIDQTIEDQKYHAITFMDVLEHLENPDLVLQLFKKKLKPHGKVYISLPNVVNIVTRLKFLFGHFTYTEYGVLDKTHLRFFTLQTAFELVHSVFPNSSIIGYSPVIDSLKKALPFFPGLLSLHIILEGIND